MKNIRKIIFILMCIIFTAGCAEEGKQEGGLLLSESDTDGADTISDEEDGSGLEAGASKELPEIYVQVSGAVNAPGVYALPEGSRIFQAVELAGGVTEEADVSSLNQAKPLTDGEMIWVMTAAEAAERGNQPEALGDGDNSAKDDGKINLNTATKEELMELPGIGAAKAEAILAWREKNGSFTQIEDLMKIEGIKEGVFSKIENYVRVQ